MPQVAVSFVPAVATALIPHYLYHGFTLRKCFGECTPQSGLQLWRVPKPNIASILEVVLILGAVYNII